MKTSRLTADAIAELSTANLRKLAQFFDVVPSDPFNHRPVLLERLLAMEENLRRFGCPDRQLAEALEHIAWQNHPPTPTAARVHYAGTLFPPRLPAA